MSETDLMRYFNFDQADLEANRNGQLSRRQRDRLEGKRQAFRHSARVVGGVIAGGTLVLMAVILALGLLGPSPFLAVAIPLLFVAPLGFAAFLMTGRFETAPFAVKQLEGPVRLRPNARASRLGTGARRYALLLDGQSFSVDPALQKLVRDGERYRLYYTSDWHDILSIEPL